jgi:uncharacterized membrane protein YoaK (UPF0700 family)
VISKFPKWVWVGGWVLAFVAGIINVVGLVGMQHQAITHLTGATSMLASAVAQLDLSMALHFLAVVGSFLLGTVVSGVLIDDTALKLSRPYGIALFLESMLLLGAMHQFLRGAEIAIDLASCACGLQNAMVTTFSGTVIRTTHVSGMFTDLGIFLGHALRGASVNTLRMKLSFLVISGFFTGGVAGAISFNRIGYFTLLGPVALTGFASIGFAVQHTRQRSDTS